MKKVLVLGVFLMWGCGGPAFEMTGNVAPSPDAGPSVSDVDAAPSSPLESGTDAHADGLASDGGSRAPDAVTVDTDAGDSAPDADADAGVATRDVTADAWPADVGVVPYCPEAEFFPAFSNVCYTYGESQGWTLTGCCLPDHTCGTTYGNPQACHK